MDALFLHLYSAPDETPASALRDLLDCLQQTGIRPTVCSSLSFDSARIMAEVPKDLFESVCQSLREWGRRHRGRDASTKAPRLLTRPSERIFFLTLFLEPTTQAGATTA